MAMSLYSSKKVPIMNDLIKVPIWPPRAGFRYTYAETGRLTELLSEPKETIQLLCRTLKVIIFYETQQ